MADTDPMESPKHGRLRLAFQSLLGWNTESAASHARPKSSEIGVLESLVWFGGLIALKYAVTYGILLVLGALQRLSSTPSLDVNSELATESYGQIILSYAAFLFAQTLIEAFLVLLCIWLRLGQPKLSLRRPSITIRQLCLLLSGVAPVAMLATYFYEWTRAIGIASGISWLAFDSLLQMQLVLAYFSVPVAIALFAAAPAIIEEFIFRRLIGQGLVGRLGTTRGVLMTSTLFGLWHWTLPHVASAFVMGLFLHLTYLKTRSLTAPILVHFVNNLMWILLSQSLLTPDAWFDGSLHREYWDWTSLIMAGLACMASILTAAVLAASPRSANITLSSPPQDEQTAPSAPKSLAKLFLVAILGNAAFWWLWIEQLLYRPQFQ